LTIIYAGIDARTPESAIEHINNITKMIFKMAGFSFQVSIKKIIAADITKVFNIWIIQNLLSKIFLNLPKSPPILSAFFRVIAGLAFDIM
jgi:hypothetical protein